MEFSHRDQVSLPFVLWKYNNDGIISTFPKEFNKKFKIPTVHGGRPKIRKVSEDENRLFSQLKNEIESPVCVVCHRSPCVLSDHMNWNAIAITNFLHKPSKPCGAIVLYDLISNNHALDDVCAVVCKAVDETAVIAIVETDLSPELAKSKRIEVVQLLEESGVALKESVCIVEGQSVFAWIAQSY